MENNTATNKARGGYVTYSIVWKDWATGSVMEQTCPNERDAKALVASLLEKGFEPIARQMIDGVRNRNFLAL